MSYNFYELLRDNDKLRNMPPIRIDKRDSDKSISYNSQRNRLDTIAGSVYSDETLWRLILWANEEYFFEYDIPDNTVIRVPYPVNDVISEIQQKISEKRNKA